MKNNNYIRHAPYPRNSIPYDYDHNQKGEKAVQNGRQFCLSRSISQEPYIIWYSFMVQMCEMIISPGVFFNFKLLIFQVVRGWKGKKWPKMTKISVYRTLYFRNHISYDLHLWYTCMYNISRHIFHFVFKILIFRIIKGGGGWGKGW